MPLATVLRQQRAKGELENKCGQGLVIGVDVPLRIGDVRCFTWCDCQR